MTKKKFIKEVILISMGPASEPGTWSGVPFFLIRELKKRNIIIHEIDLEPHRYIKWIYNRIILPFISFFVTKGELSIYRSIFFCIYQQCVLVRKIKQYDSAELILGVSAFNIAIPKTQKTTVLFGDWPYSYALEKKYGNNIGIYQKYWSKHEDNCMRNADLLISLFPTCVNYINKRLRDNKAIYLGVNVVNNLINSPSPEIISQKTQKCRLVFIGRHHYMSGAISLLKAYNELIETMPYIELDIIGLQSMDFPPTLINDMKGNVRFHGYLDKGNVLDCRTYYNILKNASLYVNTTPGWVGYTSMIEAMYFYTPIIVYPCKEFIDEFGCQIDFGKYANETDNLATLIEKIYTGKEYIQMAQNAHERVSNYTWQHFVDLLLDNIHLAMMNKTLK